MHVNTDLPTFEEVVSGAFDQEVAEICAGLGIDTRKFPSRSELYVEIVRVNQLLVVEYSPTNGSSWPDGLVEEMVGMAVTHRGHWTVANHTFVTRVKLAMVRGEIPVNEIEFRDATGVMPHNEYGSLDVAHDRHPGWQESSWCLELVRTAAATRRAKQMASVIGDDEVVTLMLEHDLSEEAAVLLLRDVAAASVDADVVSLADHEGDIDPALDEFLADRLDGVRVP